MEKIQYRDFHDFDSSVSRNLTNAEYCIADKDNEKWIPFLSFPITQFCNFRCTYCGIGGEATASANRTITVSQVNKIVELASQKGVRKYRITGGEPFTHKNIGEILDIFNNLGAFTLVNTNGSLLTRNEEILRKLNNNIKFAVSLDTLVPEKLPTISGVNVHKDVIEGIRLLKELGLLMRLNMVVTKYNYDEIYNMIAFCNELGCDLKLLDVVSVPVPFGTRQSIYQEISSLEEEFSDKCDCVLSHEYTRGFGTPCKRYCFGNTRVTVKNSVKGSHYDRNGDNAICKECPYFPCHEGLYDLFALADGRICSCRWTEKQESEDTSVQLDYLISAFKRSQYIPKTGNIDMAERTDLK